MTINNRYWRAFCACAVVAAVTACGNRTQPAAPAPADAAASGASLARARGCLVCHGIDKANLGPAYRDVARKYAGDPGAAAHLVNKVKTGGSGAWGTTPMPPQLNASDEDINRIVQWVLTLR
jgi:cytochrome c